MHQRQMGVLSSADDFQVPFLTLYEYCLENYERVKELDCWIDAANASRKYTFQQARDAADALGKSLIVRGIKKDDVVAIYSYNSIHYGVLMLACWSIGATVTTLNYLYTVDEILYQLKDASAKCLFAAPDGKIFSRAKSAAGTYGIPVYGMSQKEGWESLQELVLEGLKSSIPSFNQRLIDVKNDVAMLLYSSGTTGRPKGVMITHYNIVAANKAVGVVTQSGKFSEVVKEEFTQLALNPMFHIAGLNTIINSLNRPNKVVVIERFNPKIFLDAVTKYKIQIMTVTPPTVVFLAKHPLVDKYDLSCLKAIVSGAAPLSKEVAEAAKARIGGNCVILQAYGMTELSPVSHILPPGTLKLGSIGKVMPNTLCKIIDVDTGVVCGPYTEGEICVKGPQVMKGYVNNEVATMNTIDADGYLHTGDVGYYDNEGFFFVVDRLKELIKYNAYQVPPAELEDILLSHPSIDDAAVVGVPDERAGELPKAYVVRKPGHSLTADEVSSFVKKRVAPQKQLRGGVEFLQKIPKTETGKILRRQLKLKAAQSVKAKL